MAAATSGVQLRLEEGPRFSDPVLGRSVVSSLAYDDANDLWIVGGVRGMAIVSLAKHGPQMGAGRIVGETHCRHTSAAVCMAIDYPQPLGPYALPPPVSLSHLQLNLAPMCLCPAAEADGSFPLCC